MTESQGLEKNPTHPASATGARLLLGTALVLGLVRFWRLGDWSLWYDEAITWADAHHAVGTGEIYNPAGYLLIRAVVGWFGQGPDEFALRIAPALMGYLAIPMAYWAFSPVAGGRRAALVALLLAISPWQLYWSQNARFYTMAEVAAIAGSGLVLRGLFRPDPAPRVTLLCAGVAIIASGLLFHLQNGLLVAALVVAPLGAHVAGAKLSHGARRATLFLLAAALLGAALASPWAVEVWSTYGEKKSIGSVPSRLAHFVRSTGFYLTPLLGTGFLIGAVRAFRERDPVFTVGTLVALLGIGAGALASLETRVTAQYVFVFFPWVALVASAPIAPLRSSAARERRPQASPEPGSSGRSWLAWGYGALLVAPALASSLLYQTVRFGERPRWREAYEYVWQARGPEDLVLGMAAPVGEFYLAPGKTDLRQPERIAWLDGFRAQVPHRWARHARRTWFVVRPDYLEDWPAAERAAMQRLLREECRLQRSFPVTVEGRGLSLEVYVRDPQ